MKFIKNKKTEEPVVRNPRDHRGKTAPVFSYYSKRSVEGESSIRNAKNAQAPAAKSKTFWLGYLPSLLSLIVIILAAAYLTTLSSNPRVAIASKPEQPAVVQPTKVYEERAQQLLKGSLMNRSKLTINTDKLASQLENEFPELGQIVVAIPLISRRPLLQTSPAAPSIILSGKGGSFVIDNRGIPILKANKLPSSVKERLPVVTDSSDTSIELGKQIVTTELVAFIEAVHAQLRAKDVLIEAYTLPSLANELHVRLVGKGYLVKFNTGADPKGQVGTFLVVQERLDSENKSPSEYIDVRVDERAYIK
jgi:hypothetical protein